MWLESLGNLRRHNFHVFTKREAFASFFMIPIIGFTSGDVEYYGETSQEKFDLLVPKPMDCSDLYELGETKAIKELN